MKTIQFYSGLKNGYESFSNFHHAPFSVTINGEKLTFPTVEHYFHFKKATLFGDIDSQQQILQATDPLAVKKIGRTVKNFDAKIWDAVAPKHLSNGIYAKFTQNPLLKKKLLDTGDTLLQEANPYDNKYGIGKDGSGENLTGKCLMNVRELIKEQHLKRIQEKEKENRQQLGDITTIEKGYIMHQVNCQNVMGAGVAKALATKYPQVKEAYHEFAKKYPNPKDRLGLIQPVTINPKLVICNSFTQFTYGNSSKTGKVYTDENKLIDALSRLDQKAKQHGMPAYVPARIGCGLAGGDWERIKKHILDNTSINIIDLAPQPQREPKTKEKGPDLSI